MRELTGQARGTYALSPQVGRRRKPEPPAVVTVVLRSGEQNVLPAHSALAKAIASLAGMLASW